MGERILSKDQQLRRARFVWIYVAVCIGIFTLFGFIFPENPNPQGTEVTLFSLILIAMMPTSIGIQSLFYRYFRDNKKIQPLGGAILVSFFAISPSVYGFLIGMLSVDLRQLGILLGLSFSLIALGLGWIFTTSLFDQDVSITHGEE